MRFPLGLRLLVVLALAAAGPSAQIYPNEISATGTGSPWLAVGDVDGDGRADVAARGANTTVRILYGDGAGSFASFAEFAMGIVNGVTLADADGDGDEDLLAALCFPQELRLLRGDGSGALGAPETLALGWCLNEVVCADVNEDAVPDLLATTLNCSCVIELLGDGAGGFLTPQVITATIVGKSQTLALADYDEDGHVDLALGPADSVNKVQILLGDGTGAFANGPQITIGGDRPFGLAAGDLNGDGHADIAAACGHTSSNPGVVSLLFGDGAGGFSLVTLTQFVQPLRIEARDAEGDGDLDLFVLDTWRSQVAVLPNDGAGNFGAPADIVTPLGPWGPGVADFDSDGLQDVATVGVSLGGVTVARGLPGGTFLTARRFPITQLGDSAAVGDVNSDGRLDVVLGELVPNGSVGVLLGDGAGGFTVSASIPSGPSPGLVALADLDEDGPLDLVTLDSIADTVQWFRGNGAAGFAAPVVTPLAGAMDFQLALGDLDGDGHLDAVAAGVVGGGPVVEVLRGKGDGGWWLPPLTASVISQAQALAVGDVDGDGHADVAAAHAAGVTILRGFTASGFASVSTHRTATAAQSVALADVDLDAKLDLVAGHTGQLGVSLGDGAGAFGGEFLNPIGNGAATHTLGVADVSGDGWPDVVVGRLQQERVFVMLGDGSGTFQSVSVHVLGHQGVDVELADLDGDGRTEMLTGLRNMAGQPGGALVVLPNLQTPFTWKDLGHGLAGAAGVPLLAGHGTLATASTVSLSLAGAAPLKPAYLVVGHALLAAPFKGGVLVPFPSILIPLATNASGGFALSGTVQPGIPPGFAFNFQVWVVDAGGPAGFAATRGLSGTTPP